MPRALDGDFAPRAASRILAKDVGIACDVAARARADATFAQAARRAFLDTVDAGYGEDDDAAIVRRAREKQRRRWAIGRRAHRRGGIPLA